MQFWPWLFVVQRSPSSLTVIVFDSARNQNHNKIWNRNVKMLRNKQDCLCFLYFQKNWNNNLISDDCYSVYTCNSSMKVSTRNINRTETLHSTSLFFVCLFFMSLIFKTLQFIIYEIWTVLTYLLWGLSGDSNSCGTFWSLSLEGAISERQWPVLLLLFIMKIQT